METLKKCGAELVSERQVTLLTALQATKPCSSLPAGKWYNFSRGWHAMREGIVYSNEEGRQQQFVGVSSGLYPDR